MLNTECPKVQQTTPDEKDDIKTPIEKALELHREATSLLVDIRNIEGILDLLNDITLINLEICDSDNHYLKISDDGKDDFRIKDYLVPALKMHYLSKMKQLENKYLHIMSDLD